jgi:hypothetical protein
MKYVCDLGARWSDTEDALLKSRDGDVIVLQAAESQTRLANEVARNLGFHLEGRRKKVTIVVEILPQSG